MNLIKLFNKEYLKENIKKSRGFIILFLVLVPLFTALYTVLSLHDEIRVTIVDKLDIMWINLIGMYVIPLVLSFTLFGYVYKRNSVDFINSMPINRKTIFVTNTIGGILLITLIQIVTAIILVICDAIFADVVIFSAMITDMLILMWVSYIFVFVATNLAMTFSGTFLTQIALTMLILFLIPFCIDSYHEFDVDKEINFVNENGYFAEYVYEEDGYTMPYRILHHTISGARGDIYSNKSILRMVLVGALYFGLGMYFFQKRKMENTEESFSSIKTHIFVKALTIFPMIILLNLAEPDFESVIFILALIIVYYFIFDYIVKRKVSLKVSIPCLILILGIMQGICMGAEGIRENMPKKELNKEDVVAISIGDNDDYSRNWYYYNNSLSDWEYFVRNQEIIDIIFESARKVEEYYRPKESFSEMQPVSESAEVTYAATVELKRRVTIEEHIMELEEKEKEKGPEPDTLYVDFILKTKFGSKKVVDFRILREDYYKIIEILEKDENFMAAIRERSFKKGEIAIENLLTNDKDKEFFEKELREEINKMTLEELFVLRYTTSVTIKNYYYDNHSLVENIYSIDLSQKIFKKAAEMLNNQTGILLTEELKKEDGYISSFYLENPDIDHRYEGSVYFDYENDEIIDFILKHYDEEFDTSKEYYMIRGYIRSYRDNVYFFTNRIEEINEIVNRNNRNSSGILFEPAKADM